MHLEYRALQVGCQFANAKIQKPLIQRFADRLKEGETVEMAETAELAETAEMTEQRK